MKYSLKNKQFRKRNNIFGERKRDEFGNQELIDYLEEIRELGESVQESKVFVDYGREIRNNKISKFINFQTTNEQVLPPKKMEQRKTSVQPRPGKHGLSPNLKPTYSANPSSTKIPQKKIEETRKKKIEIKSQVVSFQYVGKKMAETDEELKEVVAKIYSIILKNNDRINQIETLLFSMMETGKLMMRQLNKGVQKTLRVQQKLNLFTNTMRSVYQNLRICKLKQQNIELYLKQQNKENEASILYEQQVKDKPVRPKYRLDDLKKQMTLSVQDPQSKQLISLVDYQSNYSESESVLFQEVKPAFFQRRSKHQFTLSLTQHQIVDKKTKQLTTERSQNFGDNEMNFKKPTKKEKSIQSSAKNSGQLQKLSPFQANKIISNSNHEKSISRYSNHSRNSSKFSHYQESQPKNESFETFRTNNKAFQSHIESQKLKTWLKKLGLKGFKCWRDEMGCLRRPNMTYVFYQNGQVISLTKQSFISLVEQGQLTAVCTNY